MADAACKHTTDSQCRDNHRGSQTRKQMASLPDNRLKVLFADDTESDLDLVPDEHLKKRILDVLHKPALPAPLPLLPAPKPMLPQATDGSDDG